jgi:ParB family transcriptional regulator, chromosome partitioning protein
MENQVYQEIELKQLRPNPHNPRKRFSGTRFDEFVTSIDKKGVLEPILARPMPDDGFEIVAGERRYRARLKLAEGNGGIDGHKIPAIVRELTDEEAFDVMCIENLQREDLTELEEAEGFKIYLNKRGADALPDLAERTGINPRYIRRRVAVLALPKKTLKAWEDGYLKYGHLEQLSRLFDKHKIKEYTKKAIQWKGGYSVRDMRDEIEREAPALKNAKFDKEKTGCPSCRQNSDVQKTLFELSSMKNAHCMDPKCFKRNQSDWLTRNWKKSGYRRHHGTNGFRFSGDVNHSDYEMIWDHEEIDEKCTACDSFVTLLMIDGSVFNGRACIGDKGCFRSRGSDDAGDGSTQGGNKRPSWHGEYFREKFYQQTLPMRLQEVPLDDDVSAAVMLFALLKSNSELHEWFGQKHGKFAEEKEEQYYSHHISYEEIWKMVSTMSSTQAKAELKEASILVVTLDQNDTESRRAIADHIGISLKEEWRITEEYLKKKTIAEIKKIAEDFKIFEQPAAKTFLYETLLKKRGKFNSCKKGELIKIFLESGVDLAGVVPDEVLEKTAPTRQ